jgi:hypothetical protein
MNSLFQSPFAEIKIEANIAIKPTGNGTIPSFHEEAAGCQSYAKITLSIYADRVFHGHVVSNTPNG